MLNLWKSVIKTDDIEFLCDKEDFGVIPEPYPARKLMPEWFKALPPKVENKNKLENSTIKRCAPFLDAMCLGWIIPLAADVEFVTNDDVTSVNYRWSFYKTMIENHSQSQLSTETSKHPSHPKPPMKFMNYWMIKVPKGYSVDSDVYFEYVNFPFFFKTPNYTGLIKAGTPLVQVIPIKRDTILEESEVKVMSPEDIEERAKTRRKRQSHESHYRDNVWVRK
jgi:hypothetical protein